MAEETVDSIRDAIVSILTGVTGIGRVHSYDRLATDMREMVALLKTEEGIINACMVRRERMAKRWLTVGSRERAHIYTIRVFMGLSDGDATGETFDDLLTSIEDAFDANSTLGGLCDDINPSWGPMAGLSGIQIELSDDRVLGGVLCHYAELRLCAVEEET